MTAMARLRGGEMPRLNLPDPLLLGVVVVLLGLGVVMVSSASLHLGARFGNPFHYVDRHLLALALGVCTGLVMWTIPLAWWERASTVFYFVALALLLLVMIPGIGKTVNGATRWIALGSFNLQTSEFMKLALVLYMAGYLVRRQVEVAHSLWGFVKPMILVTLACSLLMLQPDFGTTTVLLATALGMLFLGGAPLWQFMALLGLAGSAMAGLVLISPYRMARVTSFLDPWADPLDSGYQLAQALIAFGRGEWFGVGLGNGIQKQFYLPEAHTDFVMAVIGEEFGLMGTLAVIGLFGLLVWRAFSIGAAAQQREARFAAYVAYGVGLWLGLQAFINLGVNVGLLPTKGLTLPFISYGSNSLMVACAAVGLLLRIQRENRAADDTDGGGRWQRV
jgi:cell division protein FtsW